MDVTYVVERRRSADRRELPRSLVGKVKKSDRRLMGDRRGTAREKVIPVSDFDQLIVELEQIPHLENYDVFASVDDHGSIYKVSVCVSKPANGKTNMNLQRCSMQ